MSFKHGYGTIVKDGLVTYWDASNIQSYVSNYAQTWRGITRVVDTATLTGNASIGTDQTLRSGALSSYTGDGSGDYAQINLEAMPEVRPSANALDSNGFTVVISVLYKDNGAHGFWANDGLGQSNHYGMSCGVNVGSNFYCRTGDGTGAFSSDMREAETNASFKENEWYHVAFKWTNSTNTNWQIWVDGIQYSTSTSGTGGTLAYSTSPAYTGAIGIDRTVNSLNGNIARLLVYDRNLTEAEIVQDFNVHKIRFE